LARVTILSGPIGAGKRAVSRALIPLWSGPLAHIEGDQFWPFLVKRAEGDRREGFRVIMRAMLRPSLEVCEARARDRVEGRIAKYDRGFYALFSPEDRHVVSEDTLSPEAIAEIIYKGLSEGSGLEVRRQPDQAAD
jgi:hypothetical protein